VGDEEGVGLCPSLQPIKLPRPPDKNEFGAFLASQNTSGGTINAPLEVAALERSPQWTYIDAPDLWKSSN